MEGDKRVGVEKKGRTSLSSSAYFCGGGEAVGRENRKNVMVVFFFIQQDESKG